MGFEPMTLKGGAATYNPGKRPLFFTLEVLKKN